MSKYNPEEDSNYPKVGDIIDNEKKVRKVEHVESSNLYKLLTGKKLPEDANHLMIVDNPELDSIKYLVWWENRK
jgi:hypothetical protein